MMLNNYDFKMYVNPYLKGSLKVMPYSGKSKIVTNRLQMFADVNVQDN